MHRAPTAPELSPAVDAGAGAIKPAREALATRAAEERLTTRYERLVKPAIDRLGALLLLTLLAPVMALVALTIRVRLGKGVLFCQDRVGFKGVPFTVYKFRTMEPDRRNRQARFEGPDRRERHKSERDPRHTRLGQFLRATSLDELPQLWNVLRGDLSLIGPRPELVKVVDGYEDWQHRRHAVKPGVTGLWQVTERDERGEMHLHVDTDLRYVNAVSWRTDLRILAVTPPAILGYDMSNVLGVGDIGKDVVELSDLGLMDLTRQVA